MPYRVAKAAGGGYVIRNKTTGKTVGHSPTKARAQASIRARNAAKHGWRPTRGGKR